MVDFTENFGLSKLSSGEGLHASPGRFASTDRDTIDQALYSALTHRHTGLDSDLTEPDTAPNLTLSTTGGTIPAATTVRYKYTYVDPEFGETAPSPEATVTTADPLDAPAAPTASQQSIGGTLSPGSYYYVLTHYQGSDTVETKALSPVQVIVPAGTSTNEITLTLPTIDAEADGFNLYRRSPNQTRYYHLATLPVTATPPTEYVDDGTIADNCDRTLPPTNTTNSTNSITVAIPGATPAIPAGYQWKLYRTYVAGDYSDSFIVQQDENDLDYLDDGDAANAGAPPSVSALGTSPEKVLLTGGAEVQGLLPASMVDVNDQATPWSELQGDDLEEVLSWIDSNWGVGGTALPQTVIIANTSSPADLQAAADYVCDGTNDEVQFAAAAALSTANTDCIQVLVAEGSYSFDATCELNASGGQVRYYGPKRDVVGQLWPDNITITATGAFSLFEFTGGSAHYTFENFYMKYGITGDADGAIIDATTNGSLTMRNCRTGRNGPGVTGGPMINVAGTGDLILEGCYLESFGREAVRVDMNYSISGHIRDCWLSSAHSGGFPIITLDGGIGLAHSHFVVSHNSGDDNLTGTIRVDGAARGVTISDNVFSGDGSKSFNVIELIGGAEQIVVADNQVEGSIALDGVSNCMVTGNLVRDAGFSGIYLGDTSGSLVTDNVIIDPSRNGAVYYGIWLDGTYGASANNVITGNVISAPNTTPEHGILVQDVLATGNVVRDNKLFDGLTFLDTGTSTVSTFAAGEISGFPQVIPFAFADMSAQENIFAYTVEVPTLELLGVRANVTTAPTTDAVIVDVLVYDPNAATPAWASIFSGTFPTIATSEEVSDRVVPVTTTLTEGMRLRVDITQEDSGATAEGLLVNVYGVAQYTSLDPADFSE